MRLDLSLILKESTHLDLRENKKYNKLLRKDASGYHLIASFILTENEQINVPCPHSSPDLVLVTEIS